MPRPFQFLFQWVVQSGVDPVGPGPGRREHLLLLHHKFKRARQALGMISIFEVHTTVVKVGSGHPVFTEQQPMACGYR